MAVIRYYRLVSLFALVAFVLACFLALFFIWVIIPVAAIGLLYLGFGFTGRASALPLSAKAREERRSRLEFEATARKRTLERERRQADAYEA
jgi:hypothetical protein